MSRFVDVTPPGDKIWEGECWVDTPAFAHTLDIIREHGSRPNAVVIYPTDFPKAGGERLMQWCAERHLTVVLSYYARPGAAAWCDLTAKDIESLRTANERVS